MEDDGHSMAWLALAGRAARNTGIQPNNVLCGLLGECVKVQTSHDWINGLSSL